MKNTVLTLIPLSTNSLVPAISGLLVIASIHLCYMVRVVSCCTLLVCACIPSHFSHYMLICINLIFSGFGFKQDLGQYLV